MGLFKKAIIEDFIIVHISTGLMMNEVSHPIIVNLVKSSSPTYWQLLNPDSYIAYFRSRKPDSRPRADLLLSGVQNLILNDDKFADFKVGIGEGPMVTEINWKGKVLCPPLGGAGNIASKNQKGKQELYNQNAREGR
jgi:hypothetical protein